MQSAFKEHHQKKKKTKGKKEEESHMFGFRTPGLTRGCWGCMVWRPRVWPWGCEDCWGCCIWKERKRIIRVKTGGGRPSFQFPPPIGLWSNQSAPTRMTHTCLLRLCLPKYIVPPSRARPKSPPCASRLLQPQGPLLCQSQCSQSKPPYTVQGHALYSLS